MIFTVYPKLPWAAWSANANRSNCQPAQMFGALHLETSKYLRSRPSSNDAQTSPLAWLGLDHRMLHIPGNLSDLFRTGVPCTV
jgi:hypothetical protein